MIPEPGDLVMLREASWCMGAQGAPGEPMLVLRRWPAGNQYLVEVLAPAGNLLEFYHFELEPMQPPAG